MASKNMKKEAKKSEDEGETVKTTKSLLDRVRKYFIFRLAISFKMASPRGG